MESSHINSVQSKSNHHYIKAIQTDEFNLKMNLNKFFLFVLLVIFIAPPIPGRPQPHPCVSIIRQMTQQITDLERTVSAENYNNGDGSSNPMQPAVVSPPPPPPIQQPAGNTPQPRVFNAVQTRLKADYDKLLKEYIDAGTQLQNEQTLLRDAIQAVRVAAGPPILPTAPGLLNQQAVMQADFDLKRTAYDNKKKALDDAKAKAGIK